jgi:cytochrome c-type biogenesis protein
MTGALLAGGSIVAAFFAGAIALFSPCCVVFLLPAYMATAVKNRRWKLLPLTLIFATGIAVVLLPVMLGVGILSNTLQRWHTPLYYVGGVLLLALAVLSFLGKSWSMPSFVRSPGLERGGDTGGIFALGVFSGVASSCCAPVLAGVMTLSALSRSLVGSVILGLAYVFGMSFPLFLTALFWDRFKLGERRLLQAKPVTVSVRGRKVETNTMNLVAAAAFGIMGILVLLLAANGNTTATPGFQRTIGQWLTSLLFQLQAWLKPVPEPILVLGLFALAAFFVVAALRDRDPQPAAPTQEGACCHDVQDDQAESPQPASASESPTGTR